MAYPRSRPIRWRSVSFSSAKFLQQVPVAAAREISIRLARFLRLLLETVKHINRIFEPGEVEHPERPSGVPDPDFFNSRANAVHGLPVIRLATALHLIELKSCRARGCLRQCAQVFE